MKSDLAIDAPAKQPSDADAFARENCSPEHLTCGISLSSSHLAVGLLTVLQNLLLPSGLQAKLLEDAAAALGDALAGPAAPPSLRLRLRRDLRVVAQGAYAARRIVQAHALATSLAHMPLGLATEAELASALCALLLLPFSVCTATSPPPSPPPPPPLLRAVAAASALAADALGLTAAAAEVLAQQPRELAAGVGKVLDLVLGAIGVVDGCQEVGHQLLGAEAEAEAEAKIGRPCGWVARKRRREDGSDRGVDVELDSDDDEDGGDNMLN
ncbi:hypothetical protein PLESTF_001128000 [Pleodorina starrii]|nr:hypothetical protein PLESTF_001128000 [Pleodorina starrii]